MTRAEGFEKIGEPLDFLEAAQIQDHILIRGDAQFISKDPLFLF